MIKAPLYLVSLIPVIYSWISAGYRNPIVFMLILVFAIASQLSMNIEMDSEDLERGLKCFYSEPLLNVGPCHMMILKQYQIKAIRALSLGLMLIIAIIVLLITKMLILIFYGLAGIVLMYAYLKKPLELYKRGLGEISTFFDFGPILVLGSYTAVGRNSPLSVLSIAVGFGLIASSIRYSHHLVEEKDGSRRKRFYPYVHLILLLASAFTVFSFLKVVVLIPAALIVSAYAIKGKFKTWADIFYMICFFAVAAFL